MIFCYLFLHNTLHRISEAANINYSSGIILKIRKGLIRTSKFSSLSHNLGLRIHNPGGLLKWWAVSLTAQCGCQFGNSVSLHVASGIIDCRWLCLKKERETIFYSSQKVCLELPHKHLCHSLLKELMTGLAQVQKMPLSCALEFATMRPVMVSLHLQYELYSKKKSD